MTQKDPEDKPSLELPSFGFGRRRSKAKAVGVAAVEAPATKPAVPDAPADPPAPVAPNPDASISTVAPALPRTRVERTDPYVRPAAAGPAAAGPAAVSVEEPAPESATDVAPRGTLTFPAIGALQAALVVGALVGLLGVLLIFASLRSCELVRGTDSCGASGLLLLIATVVALTYVGAWLLRGFGIDDPGSTSFLAVALLAVMVMVFLLDVIYSWWLVFVVPPVSMAMYALSWWVTTRVVETDDASR